MSRFARDLEWCAVDSGVQQLVVEHAGANSGTPEFER